MDTINGIPALADTEPASMIGAYTRALRTALNDGPFFDSGWQTVTYGTGWNQVNSTYAVRARRNGNRVNIRGALTRSSGGVLTSLFTLPDTMWPASNLFVGSHVMSAGGAYELLVQPDGVVAIPGGYTAGSLPATGGSWPVVCSFLLG